MHGKQLTVAAVLERFGLKQRVNSARALDPRTAKGKGYDPVVYVTGILFSLTRGGCSLKEVEALNEGEALMSFLGLSGFRTCAADSCSLPQEIGTSQRS